MKKLTIILLSTGLILFSCNKDDKDNTGFVDVDFGTETVEQNKDKLEDSGQDFVAQMDLLKDEEGISAIGSFTSFLETSMPFGEDETMNANIFNTLYGLKSAAKNNNPKLYIDAIMEGDDPESIAEIWDQLKGIYTWNSDTEEWDIESSETVAEFHFPSTEDGTTNNAVFAITSYTGIEGISPVEDYTGDLPTSLEANLKIDGVQYFAYSFSASYNDQGEPTSVSTSVTLGTYVLSASVTNTDTQIGATYSFKNGETIIFDFGLSTSGNFDEDNLNNEDLEPDDVIYSGNAHFQLMNVKIAGTVDMKKMMAAEREIYADDESEDFDWIEADSLFTIEINKYAKLIVYFTDTEKKIADIEAYTYLEDETEWYYVWNDESSSYEWQEVEVTESYIDMRMVFADDSKNDMETYFKNGFTDLVNDINSLISDLNDEYGIEIDPIEY